MAICEPSTLKAAQEHIKDQIARVTHGRKCKNLDTYKRNSYNFFMVSLIFLATLQVAYFCFVGFRYFGKFVCY